MPKYVLAYHGGSMPETKEEQGKVMAAWGAWMGGLGGNPVGQSATVNADGSISQDGGSNPLSGYSLLNADNQEAALRLQAAARFCSAAAASRSLRQSKCRTCVIGAGSAMTSPRVRFSARHRAPGHASTTTRPASTDTG